MTSTNSEMEREDNVGQQKNRAFPSHRYNAAQSRIRNRVRQQERRALVPAVTDSNTVYLGPMMLLCEYCQAEFYGVHYKS